LIVLDLAPPQDRAAGAAIVAGYERYDPARYGEAVTSLDVSWNAATCPPGWYTAGGGWGLCWPPCYCSCSPPMRSRPSRGCAAYRGSFMPSHLRCGT
jgi:hypothetical protein